MEMIKIDYEFGMIAVCLQLNMEMITAWLDIYMDIIKCRGEYG